MERSIFPTTFPTSETLRPPFARIQAVSDFKTIWRCTISPVWIHPLYDNVLNTPDVVLHDQSQSRISKRLQSRKAKRGSMGLHHAKLPIWQEGQDNGLGIPGLLLDSADIFSILFRLCVSDSYIIRNFIKIHRDVSLRIMLSLKI